MSASYREIAVTAEPASTRLEVRLRIFNRERRRWRRDQGCAIGWQIYDPATGLFLSEGEWLALGQDVAPGEAASVELSIELPSEAGPYRVYVSLRDEERGWLYLRGAPMLVIDAAVEDGAARLVSFEPVTLSQLRRRNILPGLRAAALRPILELWRNRALIRSMVKREILSRYRGSLGDVLWTILNPLLLMLTYFFVFGIVLESRFGNDPSRTGFALYFLAGMLPWLAFSEPASRAAYVIVEHRNFVKKLVFPVSVLPVNQALAGLVTALFATAALLVALLVIRHSVPATALLLPLLVAPQLLFTVGVCWFLAALGVYIRDLAHMMPFFLTLWFFLTPICYPETSVPAALAPVLAKNPIFQFVRAYRQILLEGTVPLAVVWVQLWLLSSAVFLAGNAWFHRLRRSFADVV